MSQLALHDDDVAQHGSSSSNVNTNTNINTNNDAIAVTKGDVNEKENENVDDFSYPPRRSSRVPVRQSVFIPDYSLDSPTIGRTFQVTNSALSSYGSLPTPSPRASRPPIPSPLSGGGIYSTSPTSPSPRSATFPLRTISSAIAQSQTIPEFPTKRQTSSRSFYSDSSDSESPEPETPRLDIATLPNDMRSVSDPLIGKPVQGSFQSFRPAMAGPVVAAQAETRALPRNSSIDSAISAISSLSTNPNHSQDGQGTAEIANLIKTAGSPEAVIQYLLKEKQSQSQQNSQLWRLVDKQRAMILGLNKDLERALKDKEKYRKKLKEVMAIPAISRTGPGQDSDQRSNHPTGTAFPRVNINRPKEHAGIPPDSPTLDSDSHGHSPIDMALAPYPITPPADQLTTLSSAVGDLLDPTHAMPKPQEHAYDKFDHEAEDKAADEARKVRGEEELNDMPFSLSLPPSRSLPSEPPKMPPPNPPTGRLPTVAVVEATPQPDEGLSQFPVPPPRKPPPAPLQLQQGRKPTPVSPPDEEETDSDYDDILEVNEIVRNEKRGRRKTREEDDHERAIIALKEAAARSASKKSKSSLPAVARDTAPGITAVPPPPQPNAGNGSLDAMLSVEPREIMAPLRSPGLPLSPRPVMSLNSPPMSPRTLGSFPAAPLSPRPPRGPIPLPPNTPLVTAPSTDGSLGSQGGHASETGFAEKPASQEALAERTRIYKGLVAEEYSDLLLPPNALPSIMIKVASSRMKPSRASLLSLTQLEEDPVFTLAIISRSDNGELWRVEKDSASLMKLDQRMKQCSSFTARTPDRSLFSGHAPAKLDARRHALEHYMDELLNTPFDTDTALDFCKYLSTHTLPPNADETGGSGDVIAEVTGTKIGADGRPRRSGYLTKRGKNFGGWKARFFVLDGPYLKYYEAPGGAHMGTIKLQGAQIGKQSQNSENQSPSQGPNGEDLDNQYRHAFLILEPKKKDTNSHVKHVLCAENDAERDRWVDALLQWIDYRDPSEMEPPSSAKGTSHRQHAAPERSTGGKSKRGGERFNHQTSDSDTLIGVRYDATSMGDAPQSTPSGRPKTSSGLPENPAGQAPNIEVMSQKVISGPKDGQVISDTAAWGNRALAAPSNEEKKARKRSFFGFGPRARSSTDGQDSLFGGSDGASGATPPQSGYHGPVRQAFGAPLADAVRFSPPTDVNVPLPAVVFRCIQYLDAKNAILEEGIFRLSGSNIVIRALRERFNTEGDVNLVTDEQYYDIHAVASLLKLYLRELPTTILTRDLHLEFMATTEMTDRTEKTSSLNALVQRLPQANGTLLKYLIAFLIKIINNADINKMTVRNVGIVFSPTLNIPAPVFAMFLQNYEAIFGINAEEYELPSSISESETHDRFPEPPSHFEPPRRPSTSSGAASPHRQAMREPARDHQRSTPTPPLMNSAMTGRGSPSSVGGYRPGYDAAYGGQPSASLRPAYEAGYNGAPAGYEGQNVHHAGRPSPGYDRALFPPVEGYNQGSAGYDQGFNGPNRHRESAIFMGGIAGLQHQGSKSRLREETRF